MIVIDNVMMSDDIVTKKFACNTYACKGACCWEGDFGAPVTDEEIDNINSNLETIKNELPINSVKYLDTKSPFEYYDEATIIGTALHPDGACVFLNYDEKGIGYCGIEAAYHKGNSSVNKPISCHLYPVRVEKNIEQNFEIWNYDKWSICEAACARGSKENIPIYKFLKAAIIRYKGEEFYEQLEAAAADEIL